MSEIHDIKRRLSAVAQTRQITNAMYLLSSTRMKRESKRVEYAKEYFHLIRTTVRDIMEKSQGITHPYLEKRSGDRAAFLVIAGDKGLCGGYNSNVLNYALEQIQTRSTCYIETVGRVATDFFRKRGMTPDAETLGAAHAPTLNAARDIVYNLFGLYRRRHVDEIYIVFTRFISAGRSEPSCVRLLPLTLDGFEDVPPSLHKPGTDMLYEPSPQAVFDRLVPQCAVGLVFAALVQASASEHSARMNAMRSAMDNADEMSEKLTREYQSLRQLSITNEIIEISAGAESAAGFSEKQASQEGGISS